MAIKDKSIYYDIFYWTITTQGSSTPTYYHNIRKLDRTTNGSSVPDYQKKIKEHKNATSPFTGSFVNVKETRPFNMMVSYEWFDNSKNRYVPGGLHKVKGQFALSHTLPIPSADASCDSEAIASAKGRFNKKLRSTQTSFEGLTFLGELGEAIHMLRHPAQALREGVGKYLDTVSKRNRGRRKKPRSDRDDPVLSKIAADTWLEYAFGWTPFLNDIKGAVETYQKVGQKEQILPVSAGAKVSKLLSVAYSKQNAIGVGLLFCNVSKKLSTSANCKYRGAVHIQAATNRQVVMDLFGVNWHQLVPTCWELIPYSFLVDYFTNIGDILAYDNRVYSKLAWHCASVVTSTRRDVVVTPDDASTATFLSPHYFFSKGDKGEAYCETRVVQRFVDTNWDTWRPEFQLDLPDLPRQWANMTALWASANSMHGQNPTRKYFR